MTAARSLGHLPRTKESSVHKTYIRKKMLCGDKISSHERLVKRCNRQSNDKELQAYISRLERRQGRQERAVIRAHYEENFVQKHAKFNLR